MFAVFFDPDPFGYNGEAVLEGKGEFEGGRDNFLASFVEEADFAMRFETGQSFGEIVASVIVNKGLDDEPAAGVDIDPGITVGVDDGGDAILVEWLGKDVMGLDDDFAGGVFVAPFLVGFEGREGGGSAADSCQGEDHYESKDGYLSFHGR